MNRGVMGNPGMEMAVRLRQVCEAHDATIVKHLDRVSRYTTELARLLGLPTTQLIELHYASPLHDIGKIGVPQTILDKPDQLTPEERNIVQTHTVIGHRMLQGSVWPVMQCAAQIALSHHEAWDGRGYPHGLRGEQIPLAARIVAVADVYDALVSQRAYKPAWAEDRVLEELRQGRGARFDPAILDVFLSHIAEMSLPQELMELRQAG
jgi:HD-GYP domain-containing protein (c-di-GMP phosphodiesterase class II)